MVTIFVALSSPAYAHEWYLVDPIDNQCTSTVAPNVEMDSLTEKGFSPTVAENRPDGTDLASVDIFWTDANGNNNDLTLYTSLDGCQQAVQASETSGQVVNQKDLE